MSLATRVLAALLTVLIGAGTALAGEALSRPPGLEPEIAFWRQIFSEVTTRQGLIHDNRHLGIVYEKVELSADANPARIRQVADAARGKYERILRSLAEGKRSGLTSEERRVLALWGEGAGNRELREAADRVRFQQGLSDRFYAGLLRSGQWHDHIIRQLRAAGVPEDLVALPHVESSFDPSARSFVGAAGLWQFTGGTGKRFMRIDQAVDERRDPFASSEAAARYLRYNYDILGSWPLAITAYNHGAGGMRRAAQTMGTKDIEVIIRRYSGPAFGFASRNFYVSFLAALDIEKDPSKYFGAVQRQQPREQLVVEMPDYMRIDAIESAFGIPRSTLQAYNPALLPPVWEGAKYVPRGFRLRLPADGVIAAAPGEVLASIPRSQRFAAQVPDRTYVVKSGDTLSHIARRYGTSVARLAQANGLTPTSRIRIGQTLKLPGGVAEGPAPARVAQAAAAPAAIAAPAQETYLVRPGDSLALIAQRTGVSQRDLMAFNGLSNPNLVRSGQRLRLTAPAAAAGPVPAAEEAEPLLAATESAATPATASLPGGEPAGTAALVADPSDYRVGSDDTVEVQAGETISHYAEWLQVSADTLRKANGWSPQRSLVLGQRVRLVFSKVSRDDFVARRMGYHGAVQQEFFSRFRVADTTVHRLRPGESVWVLASQKYKVPVWLLRQYNPNLRFDQVRPGTTVIFPRVERLA